MSNNPPPISWFMAEIQLADWSRSCRWYQDVLGFPTILDDPANGFLLLDAGGGRIALKQTREVKGRGAVRLIFEVVDLIGLREKLIASDCEVSEMTESAEGYRELRLTDPEGTPIHLFSWIFGHDVNNQNE